MLKSNKIEIIRPDDWHTHLREGDLLKCVINSTARIANRCIAMPNLSTPITNSLLCNQYKEQIDRIISKTSFQPLIPCYLTDQINLKDFEFSLKNKIFIAAKLYPLNSTTNSKFGVTNIENIFEAIELLIKYNRPLLIHGEKVSDEIDIFDREKYFIDDQLAVILKKFPNLKIVLEHVSSKYGADVVSKEKNLFGTITPHHMLLTKKNVFEENINPFNYCMPIVKNESDLIALRKYACSGNEKFFIGTDSAPHEMEFKQNNDNIRPGIFSAPCFIELYAEIFDQENSLLNLEKFTSINGARFYNLDINKDKIILVKKEWILDEFSEFNHIKVKNFYGGKKLQWKIQL